MSRTVYRILLVSLLSLHFLSCFSEGTKQILLNDAGHGKVQVMPSFSNFAYYNSSGTSAAEEYRLHIRVQSISETIYYGFGDPTDDNLDIRDDVTYRIKDPNGNIVVGPSPVPLSGAGHISTFSEAIAGPSAIAAGGYNALFYSPMMTGDYFIEFYFPTGGFPPKPDRTKFKYFDITVANMSNVAIDGRLWSKAWQCTADANGISNAFNGKFYIYSNDSVVTSINCNGMAPYVFTIACNQWGCYNTGNFINDRRSVTGKRILPQYKIFLNNPDISVYPTGILGSIIPPVRFIGSCAGNGEIKIDVTKAGNVEIVLNINPAPGIQAEDVEISTSVVAGMNTIPWDGLDGNGNPVANGFTFQISINYIVGLTNLPFYDIDEHPNGFIIDLVRPAGADPLVYWTDALLGGTQNLTGCTYALPSTGCHTVSLSVGNNNTINTWWYATSTASAPLVVMEKRAPQPLGPITGEDSICPGTTAVGYSVTSDPNSQSYVWTYSGTGASIIGTGPSVLVDFAVTATSGVLTVKGYNDSCGLCPTPSTLNIVMRAFPPVVLSPFAPICTTTPAFPLSGGTPLGGSYKVNGIPATTFDPAAQGVGSHAISYTFSDPVTGCTKTVTQPQVVNSGVTATLNNFASVCLNAAPFTLTGGSPAGGIYTGTGVTAGVFNPAVAGVGTFTITYTYVNASNCIGVATKPITVNPTTSIGFTPFSPICFNASPLLLTNASPTGGSYSGQGVSGGFFNPTSAGVGTHYIRYTYTNANGCTSIDSSSITVNPAPGAPGSIAGPAAVCQGSSGENYTVPPVANATTYDWIITPSTAGTVMGASTSVTINWAASFYGSAAVTVSGVNNCGTGLPSAGYIVIVDPKPVVTFTLCFDSITSTNAKIITLKGGIPYGGTYSGPGVNSTTGIFNPPAAGIGTKAIKYTLTNSYGCSSFAQKNIIVVNPAAFVCGNKFTDIRDNKKYNTVSIGTQCWMAENLNYGNYRTSDNTQRDNCMVEKYCFNNNSANCATMGGLYQWDEMMLYATVSGKQGLCPPGWHLPTQNEWTTLFSNFTNEGFAGSALKSTGYSGFNATVPGVNFFNRSWSFSNFATLFWTSVSIGETKAWARGMNSYNPSVSNYPSARSNAFSVRCIKD
jgi:uncharacterized protein (TIGR02145 family)